MLKSFEELKSSGGLNFQEFEQTRVAMQAKNKKGLMLGGIVGGAITLIGVILLVLKIQFGGFLLFVGIVTFFVWWLIANSSAKKQLKSKILGDMLKAMDSSFAYSMNDRDFIPEFRKSGFKKATSGTTVDDVFKGQIMGMNFGLGELKVVRKQGKNSTVTVYSGPFAFVQTAQKYAFTTIIPDNLESALGGFGKFLQSADISRLNQKLITIDDKEFERYFAVWTKDENQAKVILNPEFRNYLKILASTSPTYVGWRDDKIYFGMDNRRDLFNLKFKTVISESVVRQFYDDFVQYYTIVNNIVSFITTGAGASSAPVSGGNQFLHDSPPPKPNEEYYGPDQNTTPPPPPPPSF